MSQVFSLSKDSTFDLTKAELNGDLYVGASWKNKGRHDTDVDLSALVFDDQGRVLETVSFQNKCRWLLGNSFYHFGDDLTGNDAKTDADNEQIRVQLDNLPSNASSVFLIGSLYSGSLSNLTSCDLSIRKTQTGPKVVSASMVGLTGRGMIFGQIKNEGGAWNIKNLSVQHDGATASQFVSKCKQIIDGRSTATTTLPTPASPKLGFFKRLFG